MTRHLSLLLLISLLLQSGWGKKIDANSTNKADGSIKHKAKIYSTSQIEAVVENAIATFNAHKKELGMKSDMDAGGFFREWITLDCDVFSCANGATPRQSSAEITTNGCGASGDGWMAKLSRDLSSHAPQEFYECCHVHDRCYATCMSNKATCDTDMENCLEQTLSTLSAEEQDKYKRYPALMGQAVATFGCGAFESAQSTRCTCGNEGVFLASADKAITRVAGAVQGVVEGTAHTIDSAAQAINKAVQHPGSISNTISQSLSHAANQVGDSIEDTISDLIGLNQ